MATVAPKADDYFNLAIALPLTSNQECSAFWDSFIKMEKPNFGYLRPFFPEKARIEDVRNELCRKALESGYTHLLMMDTDQVYQPDTISRLLANRHLPVVCGKVHRRYPPFDPILYRWNEDRTRYLHVDDEEWIGKSGLVNVDATGCGCFLLDVEVLLNLEYPWFKQEVVEETDEYKVTGEDVYFWSKMRSAGYPIHVDLDVKIAHITQFSVDEQFYLVWKMLLEHKKKKEEQDGVSQGKGMCS
jgi:GT2 family glycosyltransferase